MQRRLLRLRTFCFCAALVLCENSAPSLHAQSSLDVVHHGHPLPDAHNCYPYDGKWRDRIDRALSAGFPIGIEQDLAWHVDPATGKSEVVVAHSEKTSGIEPTLRAHFFERVRPIVEQALRENRRDQWPLIIVHFDVKDNQEPLLRAVWKLLGEYEGWITTAAKGADPHVLAPLDIKPLLVLTEEPDIQEKIFFTELPVGSRLRVFGSGHTREPEAKTREEREHLLATEPPEQLLSEPPTNYRRWWNSSWHAVEEGGQRHAGPWTEQDRARLDALVAHAHRLGYWIRFYTLDGFLPSESQGWFADYNFGSLEAAETRWRAAAEAGVNLIASDQYETLAKYLRQLPGH